MLSGGELDPSFGTGGKIDGTPFGFNPADVAIQSDGKIVAVGEYGNEFAMSRLNANGTLDSTFAGGYRIQSTAFGGNRGSAAFAVAIQPDGRIVVAGVKRNYSIYAFGTHNEMAVARYNANGTLDATFDGDGRKTIDIGWDDSEARDIAIQGDGKIVVAGTYLDSKPLCNPDFAVARLNTDGSLDHTFGPLISSTTWRAGSFTTAFGKNDHARVVTIARDGKILVGGQASNEFYGGGSGARFAIARYNPDGTLDRSFDGDGKLTTEFPGGGAISALAVQTDGKVLAAGSSNYRLAMARFNVNGTLDGTFGMGVGKFSSEAASGANAIAITREGILAAGKSGGDSAILRFNANGSLDARFGNGGKITTDFGGDESAMALAVASDGTFLVSGKKNNVGVFMSRHFRATPTVNVAPWDRQGSEQGRDPASFVFTRDGVHDFPTRIYVTRGGTAVAGNDYNSAILNHFGYVEIPAGESFRIISVDPMDDAFPELTETVEITPTAHAGYVLGAKRGGAVSLADNDVVRINFQAWNTVTPPTYIPDFGGPFAPRSRLTYGWNIDNVNHRARNNPGSPDVRYDTLNHMQYNGTDAKWEIALPNGMYEVRLVAGDPSEANSIYRMNLEGAPALSGAPSGDVRWFRSTVNVQLSDGRLTLSNAPGAMNNKICFIDIQAAPPGAVAGPVTGNIPVSLVTPTTMSLWHRTKGGLFSDDRIDELIWT
jgi:uncharacterized delta-60 repeat protein